jgi:glutathione S-transferase
MRAIFALLDREFSQRSYLAGNNFTLADAFLLPLMHYMRLMPESAEMVQASPHVVAWFERVSARPSARETVPPPMPGRG